MSQDVIGHVLKTIPETAHPGIVQNRVLNVLYVDEQK